MNKKLSKLFAFTAILAVGFTACKKKEAIVEETPVDKTSLISEAHTLSNQNGDLVRFWSSTEDKTYMIADLGQGGTQVTKHSLIDFGYVTRANQSNKIIAPNSEDATEIYKNQWNGDAKTQITTWTVRNATKFKEATVAKTKDMNLTDKTATVNFGIINAEKAAGEPTLDAISVADGNVILFKTAAGKYGLIVVSTASGSMNGASANVGILTFKAYYQK